MSSIFHGCMEYQKSAGLSLTKKPRKQALNRAQQQELERGIVLGEKFPVPMLEPGRIVTGSLGDSLETGTAILGKAGFLWQSDRAMENGDLVR